MGELLNSLGLGGKPDVPTALPGMPAPAAAPAAPNPLAALTGQPQQAPTQQPQLAPEENVVVQGDPWKPSKVGWLGRAVDGYLMAEGMQPVFGPKREQENLKGALGNFSSDPEGSLKRLMMIPGQTDEGMTYYNQRQDNVRADAVMQRGQDALNLKHSGRLGGMLNAIMNSNDPEGQYGSRLSFLRAYNDKHKLSYEFPDKYDGNSLGTQMMGEVDVDDQIKIEALGDYRKARLGQIDNAEEGRDNRAGIAEGGRNNRADIAEGGRNARAGAAEAGRQGRHEDKNPKPRIIDTPKGKMEVNATGDKGKIGDQLWKKAGPNHWTRVK